MHSVRYRIKLEDGVWVIYKEYAMFCADNWGGFKIKLKPTFMTRDKAVQYLKESKNEIE
jgi:hypothetical protein